MAEIAKQLVDEVFLKENEELKSHLAAETKRRQVVEEALKPFMPTGEGSLKDNLGWWCPDCRNYVEATYEENCSRCGLPLADVQPSDEALKAAKAALVDHEIDTKPVVDHETAKGELQDRIKVLEEALKPFLDGWSMVNRNGVHCRNCTAPPTENFSEFRHEQECIISKAKAALPDGKG